MGMYPTKMWHYLPYDFLNIEFCCLYSKSPETLLYQLHIIVINIIIIIVKKIQKSFTLSNHFLTDNLAGTEHLLCSMGLPKCSVWTVTIQHSKEPLHKSPHLHSVQNAMSKQGFCTISWNATQCHTDKAALKTKGSQGKDSLWGKGPTLYKV